MHYYKFHIGDFRGATAHLSNEEDLAYRRLLDWYYDTERPIPEDTAMVSRRLRVSNESVLSVLRDFFVETEEGWRHERCDIELIGYQVRGEKNRENGKKGGRPKASDQPKENPAGFNSEPSGNPVQSEPNLNHKPLTTNHKPETIDQKTLSSTPTKTAKKSKIPDPFMLTAEMRAWAAESAPAVNVKTETESFVDYWRGEAKTKADWPATWRNWIRRAQQSAEKGGSGRGGYNHVNKQQQVEEANARVVQEIIARESEFTLGEPIAIDGEVIHVD